MAKLKKVTFGILMNYQSYIAILLTLVFFGKFLVVDSRILVVIFEADEIVYVNPYCKKQNAKTEGNNSQHTFAENSKTGQLAVDSFCNAPFKFEVYNWEYTDFPEESRAYAYHSPSFPKSNEDRFYPPPKV